MSDIIPMEMDVKKIGENVIFFNQEVATFEGGDVVMNIGNGTMVIQFKDHEEYEGRYAFSVQAMVNALTAHFDRKDIFAQLEDYADSIDNDINTIHNFDIACCDERELEVLQNVFDNLEKFLKQRREVNADEKIG